MFLEILKAVLIGIVQGITEWLPISSTGHMIIINELVKLDVSDAFMSMFEVVIQFGSILAVIVLYFNKLNPFAPSKSALEKTNTWKLWLHVLVAMIPTGIAGVLLDDLLDKYFYNYVTVGIALFVYGVAFIVIERVHKNKKPKYETVYDITYMTALLIGFVQILALVPGTSRSGSTILGALILGASRTAGAEFSFFLAVPVMFGASALKLLKFFLGGNILVVSEWIYLGVGMAVAFSVSLVAIKFLMSYIKKKDFTAFGIYRIILAAAVFVYFLIVR